LYMDRNLTPRVVEYDKVGNALILVFDDGRCGIYSFVLLDALFPQAQKVPAFEDEEYEDQE
jgi:hypothetical protein